MIKKIVLITSFVFSLQGMHDEVCTFISYYADYCYRQGIDFDDECRGGGYGERFMLCGTGWDSEFIDVSKLQQLYGEDQASKISNFYGNMINVDAIAPALENKKPSDVVKQFDSLQKKRLLQQLQRYGPSKTTLWFGIGLSCLGLATAGLAFSFVRDFCKSDTVKSLVRIGMPSIAGLLLGFGTKKIYSYYEDCSRWKDDFPNFQKLIRICKQQ